MCVKALVSPWTLVVMGQHRRDGQMRGVLATATMQHPSLVTGTSHHSPVV